MTDGAVETLGFGRAVFLPEHEAFRATVRRFFREEIEPNAREWQKSGFFPAELFVRAGRMGLLCANVPVEYGGSGGDILHAMILHEEHGYSAAGAGLEAGLGTDLSCWLILQGGTEAQKREWLPRFATGEVICEAGITEAGAGSDPRGIRTFARCDGDDYVINGSKMWMSNGPILTTLLTLAKTRAEDGRDQISMFIVPLKNMAGVTISAPTELMTKGSGGVAEVYFDDVRVPASALLGGVEGKGLAAALGGVTPGRVATAARCVAACELALSLTTDYAKTRKAFGQPIFEFQNTAFKLASVKTETSVARIYMDECLRRLGNGQLDQIESAMVKLWTSEVEGRVMDECLQLFGATGYGDEAPISKMFAFARVHRIVVGTSEILRGLIARSL